MKTSDFLALHTVFSLDEAALPALHIGHDLYSGFLTDLCQTFLQIGQVTGYEFSIVFFILLPLFHHSKGVPPS